MAWLAPWLIFLHILTAIVAFGPTFAFPLIGSAGSKEPQHANFATRLSLLISHRMTIPLALTMPVTGLLIIWSLGMDLFAAHWLLLAIVVYVVAIGFSITIQTRAVEKAIELSSTPPPPGAAPSGPPVELLATVAQIKRGGMFMTTCLVVIVALMVVRPTF